MEERIRKYVESLFADAPKTQKAIELRQEIYTNLIDKYNDLRETGATEEEAYEIVKKSVGNVDELIEGLYEKTKEDKVENEALRKKAALLNSIAITLYIASPIFIIALSAIGQWLPGLILLLACIAVATGIKVYGNSVYRYEKEDDTLVEEFKEWKAENREKVQKKNTYSGVMWLLIVIIYFVVSFGTGAWHISWLIFLVGAAIEQLIKINLK